MEGDFYSEEIPKEEYSHEEPRSEQLKILEMIENGRVTAEQGAALLAALENQRSTGPKHAERGRKASYSQRPQWVRVKVTDVFTGKSKASVRIPFGLMDWGLRIGAQFAPEVATIDLDELAEALRAGIDGKIVEVLDEEDGEHVEIFIE